MKKKLDTANITNELAGASLFFTRTPSSPSSAEPEKPVVEKAENPSAASPIKEKESRNIKHLEALESGIQKLLNKRTRLQQVYLDPEIGMSKDEYLQEKRLIEDQIHAAEEDIERIQKDLSHVPSEDDLVQLEEMAAQFTEALGDNLDIPDPEKRRILELLNIKVLISPDRKIKLTGFFYSPSSGVLSAISGHGTSPLWN
jgi:hypothetical protein